MDRRHGLTAVSLFAGIGGIDRALKAAGVRVTTAVEIDQDCRGVLTRHFPATRIREDVTEVTGDDLIADGFVPGRGILAAGWPCQGNSVAGRRGGMDDARSGLWRHVVRLLAETRPRWFLGENVPGLYSVNGGADIAVVRNDLAQLGYWWAERILDAQHFGVPQRRSRIFFVGCAGDRAAPVEVLLEPEGSAGHSPARGAKGQSAPSRAPGGAGATRTVGTLGASGPGGGWRVGSNEAAAGQLIAAPLTTRPYADQPAAEGSLVTAATLQGGGRRGHRIDAEGAAGGHLIPMQATNWTGNGSGIGEEGDPSFTLEASGAPKAIGFVPFDTAQITHGENRANPQPGDPSPTLNGSGLVHVAALPLSVGADEPAYALTSRASRASRASREETYIITPDTSAAITAHHGKGPDSDATNGLILAPPVAATLTSGAHADGVSLPGRHDEDQFNLVATPVAMRGRDGENGMELGDPGGPAFALRADDGGSSRGMIAHALTSEGSDASEDGTGRGTGRGTPLVPYAPPPSSLAVARDFSAGENVAQTVRSAHGQPGCVTSGLAVRRLTPVECERLQGLPDNWTKWKLVRGELIEQSDSARYREIGNSVAVPVVTWIARRMVTVDNAISAAGAA
jgi:DNA (cytosine-5)-methyltransferase 1